MSVQDLQFAAMIVTKLDAQNDEAIGLYNSCICVITGRPEYGPYVTMEGYYPTGPGAPFTAFDVMPDGGAVLSVEGLTPEKLGDGLAFDAHAGGDVPHPFVTVEGMDTLSVTLAVDGLTPSIVGDGLNFDIQGNVPGHLLEFTGPGTGFAYAPSLTNDTLTLSVRNLTPAVLGEGLNFDLIGNANGAAPINPISEYPQLEWKQGIVTNDSFGRPEEFFDPMRGGGYSTSAGMGFALMQNVPGLGGKALYQYLRDKGIELLDCIVKLYVVIDGVFTQWKEFQIQGVSPDEHEIKLDCRDTAALIHRPVLKTEVTKGVFPDAPEDSLDTFIPLSVGRVPEAEGLRVSGEQPSVLLGRNFGEDLYTTRASAWNANTLTLTLRTPGVTFASNDDQLVGKFLEVTFPGLNGPKILSPMIVSNTATAGGMTAVKLSDTFLDENEEPADPVITSPVMVSSILQNDWWFRVLAISEFQAFSDDAVHEFTGSLLGWSDELGEYFSVNQIERQSYPDGDYPPIPGPAGSLLYPRGDQLNVPTQRNWIIPRSVIRWISTNNQWNSQPVASTVTQTSDTFGDMNAPLPYLWDRDGATGYSRTWDVSVPFMATGFSQVMYNVPNNDPDTNATPPLVAVDFAVAPPAGFRVGMDERIRVGLDMDLLLSARNTTPESRYEIGVTVAIIDNVSGDVIVQGVYRRLAGGPTKVAPAVTGTTYQIRNMSGEYYLPPLPPSAWGVVDADYDPNDPNPDTRSRKDMIELLNNERVSSNLRFVVRVHIRFDCFFNIGAAVVAPFGFTIKEVALFRSRENYEGDVYRAVVGARFGGTWDGRRSPSDPVLSAPDAIEYLIRQRDGSNLVDTPSFDTVNFYRSEFYWWIGKQVTEQASTLDLIEKLCKHIYAAVVPGRDAKRRIIHLDGYGEADRTYDTANIIRDSVAAAEVVGLDRVHTGLELKYDQNPATGEYRSTVFVRKTDESAFPLESDVVPGTTTPLWTTYAGGFKGYANGKAAWENYHAAWLITRRDNVYSLECDWFQSRARVGLDEEWEDAPVFLALILSEWYSQPRKKYRFAIPVTQANLGLLLGDRINFMDEKRTGGLYYRCLVERIVLVTEREMPGDEVIEVEVSHRLSDVVTEAPPLPPVVWTETVDGPVVTETVDDDVVITEVAEE